MFDVKAPPLPTAAGLFKESRNFYEGLAGGGPKSWQEGWIRAQSIYGMTQAAFAIMKGQPIPADPIYGLPYVWDPATRTLSEPTSKPLEIKPIIVPKL
jgi:hypothetical protein